MPTAANEVEDWHAPAAAARLLHRSPSEVRALARRGQIPSRHTPGGHLRVKVSVEPSTAVASALLQASAVLAALAGVLTEQRPTAPLPATLEELLVAARKPKETPDDV